jgi:hypothetical protein
MSAPTTDARADATAARATGIGIGLVAFMITWTIGARITPHVWGPPSGALVAMGIALVVGTITAGATGRRLARGALAPERG